MYCTNGEYDMIHIANTFVKIKIRNPFKRWWVHVLSMCWQSDGCGGCWWPADHSDWPRVTTDWEPIWRCLVCGASVSSDWRSLTGPWDIRPVTILRPRSLSAGMRRRTWRPCLSWRCLPRVPRTMLTSRLSFCTSQTLTSRLRLFNLPRSNASPTHRGQLAIVSVRGWGFMFQSGGWGVATQQEESLLQGPTEETAAPASQAGSGGAGEEIS